MRLTATESGLQLDDWIAALAGKTLDHRVQQQLHAFGDKGALEEQRWVLVFGCRRAGMHAGDVGCKLSLNKGAATHVFMGFGDHAPRFEAHTWSP